MGNCCVKKSARYLFSNGFYDGSLRELVFGENRKNMLKWRTYGAQCFALVLNYLFGILEPKFVMIALNSWIEHFFCWFWWLNAGFELDFKLFCNEFEIFWSNIKCWTKHLLLRCQSHFWRTNTLVWHNWTVQCNHGKIWF